VCGHEGGGRVQEIEYRSGAAKRRNVMLTHTRNRSAWDFSSASSINAPDLRKPMQLPAPDPSALPAVFSEHGRRLQNAGGWVVGDERVNAY
jgi:hypothetical protein